MSAFAVPKPAQSEVSVSGGWATDVAAPGDINLDDGNCYFVVSGYTTGATVVFGVFDPFNIPYDARILGIEVKMEAYLNPTCAGGGAITIELSSNAGTYYSATRSIGTPTSTVTVYTLGHGGDWWGETPAAPPIGWTAPYWTPQVFNDQSSFRVRMKIGKGSTISCIPPNVWEERVDYIWPYVYYRRPSSPDIHRASLRMKRYF